jgi:hypothetical protein
MGAAFVGKRLTRFGESGFGATTEMPGMTSDF